MILFPAPMQCLAIALSVLFPLLLLGYAQFRAIRGAGVRFGLACVTVAVIYAALSSILPGERDPADVFSGCLFLIAAMLFWNVVWNLLAFGFTLTLLTAIAQADQPLTRAQWALAYMQGADLGKFARNRLQLLFGTGLAIVDRQNIIATPFGMIAAALIRSARFLFGIR
jgi:hypothetical protein